MIDPVVLRSLVAVSRLGSVVAASESLGYTPSAVSQQLKRLEAQSGVQLLERFGRGVMLTEAGRQLVTSADDLLGRMERLESELQAGAGTVSGEIRVAAFSTAYRGLLAPTLARLQHAAPALRVRLREAEPWEGIDLVAAGQVEVVVVHNWEPVPLAVPSHIQTLVLGHDRADVLLHRDHPLAGRSTVSASELAGERWVSVTPGSICHQWLTWMFHEVGATPDIAHYSQEFQAHVALVAHGLATALVPRLGRGVLPAEVVAVPMSHPAPIRTVTVAWRATMAASPAVTATVEALRETAAGVLG